MQENKQAKILLKRKKSNPSFIAAVKKMLSS